MKKPNEEIFKDQVAENTEDYCVVCKSTDSIVKFKGKSICKSCVKEAIQM